MNSVIQIN